MSQRKLTQFFIMGGCRCANDRPTYHHHHPAPPAQPTATLIFTLISTRASVFRIYVSIHAFEPSIRLPDASFVSTLPDRFSMQARRNIKLHTLFLRNRHQRTLRKNYIFTALHHYY
jgi:hypothetical protein